MATERGIGISLLARYSRRVGVDSWSSQGWLNADSTIEAIAIGDGPGKFRRYLTLKFSKVNNYLGFTRLEYLIVRSKAPSLNSTRDILISGL